MTRHIDISNSHYQNVNELDGKLNEVKVDIELLKL